MQGQRRTQTYPFPLVGKRLSVAIAQLVDRRLDRQRSDHRQWQPKSTSNRPVVIVPPFPLELPNVTISTETTIQ